MRIYIVGGQVARGGDEIQHFRPAIGDLLRSDLEQSIVKAFNLPVISSYGREIACEESSAMGGGQPAGDGLGAKQLTLRNTHSVPPSLESQ